jgi:hypothetical protein
MREPPHAKLRTGASWFAGLCNFGSRPCFIASVNACHPEAGTVSLGPVGFLESRTSRVESGRVATSTQFPPDEPLLFALTHFKLLLIAVHS